MLTSLLPLVSFAVGLVHSASAAPADAVVTSPRAAQVQLAETLAAADAIHSISAHRHEIAFAIERGGEAYRVVATTRAKGKVVSLTVTDVGPSRDDLGSLSWLSNELAEATAVTNLRVDEDGAVTISTSDGRSYMAIPGRGSGGNVAVEARWAAAWSSGS